MLFRPSWVEYSVDEFMVVAFLTLFFFDDLKKETKREIQLQVFDIIPKMVVLIHFDDFLEGYLSF